MAVEYPMVVFICALWNGRGHVNCHAHHHIKYLPRRQTIAVEQDATGCFLELPDLAQVVLYHGLD
eukprot:5119050-Pyramimonas_sp.AAC.1